MPKPSNTDPSRRTRYLTATAAGVTAIAAAGALLAVPAWAASSPSTMSTSGCANGARVSLQLQHSDPGRIEAGFEVNHATINSVWRVQLTHDGSSYFLGRRTAAAPDGSFSVDRVLPNLRGTDTVRGTARNLATGQVCTISGHI
jgi:hypothetical protein